MVAFKRRNWAPLFRLPWDGGEFSIQPDFKIATAAEAQQPDFVQEYLSPHELKELEHVSHGLLYDWSEDDEISASEIANLLLLALWIAVPTKAQIRYRFELPIRDDDQFVGNVRRLYDRFTYIEHRVADSLEEVDLRATSQYFEALAAVRRAKKRLWQAIGMSFVGCVAFHWHSAFLCHSAAAECLLTFGTGPGVTRRLAKAYCCVVAGTKSGRDRAYDEFRSLYGIRSDIMHGRLHHVRAQDRLPGLADFSDCLRLLWQHVLASTSTTAALEGGDQVREQLFSQLCGSYTPPP